MTDPIVTEAEIEAALDACGKALEHKCKCEQCLPDAERVGMHAALLAAAKVRPTDAKPVDWGQIGLDTNVAINKAFEDAARCGIGFVQITPDKSACIPPERVLLDHRRDRPPQPFTVFDRAEKAEAERDAAHERIDEWVKRCEFREKERDAALAALTSAVEAERERCARIAEDEYINLGSPDAIEQAQTIAAAIRAGESEGRS